MSECDSLYMRAMVDEGCAETTDDKQCLAEGSL